MAQLHADVDEPSAPAEIDAVHGRADAPAAHVADAAEHGGHEESDGIPELSNLISTAGHRWHEQPAVAWLHRYENPTFAIAVALFIALLAKRLARRPAMVPSGRGQSLIELFVEGMDRFVGSIIHRDARQHVPFIGTLFLYIWFMNLFVLIPGMKSPTSSLNTTVGLALVVFCYVQWTAIRAQGPGGYFHHLAGSPKDLVSWLLVPLMLPLHVLGEIIRPVSLSLRLGFNVFAEDVLLAVLVGLGLGISAAIKLPFGVPLQAFVIPLVLIFSTVQALVFSLLSSVYIALMLPHGEHHAAEPAHH